MVWSQSRWSYPKRSQHYACACVVTFDVNEGISSPSTSIIHGQKRFTCWRQRSFALMSFSSLIKHNIKLIDLRYEIWEWMGILFLFIFIFYFFFKSYERIKKINDTRQWLLYEKSFTKSTKDFMNIIITGSRICNTQIHY